MTASIFETQAEPAKFHDFEELQDVDYGTVLEDEDGDVLIVALKALFDDERVLVHVRESGRVMLDAGISWPLRPSTKTVTFAN